MTVVVVSHDLAVAQRADRVVRLVDGLVAEERVADGGETASTRAEPALTTRLR